MKFKHLFIAIPVLLVWGVISLQQSSNNSASNSATAGEATGWRCDGTGNFPGNNPVSEWSQTKNVIWRCSLPDWSNASPIIVGKRIFVCAEPSTLICISTDNGKIEWQKDNSRKEVLPNLAARQLPKTHKVNGYSSPTPASDGKYVCALYGVGTLVCYDMRGKLQWAKHIDTPSPHNWGFCTSPIICDGKVFIHTQNIIALDLKTGKPLWQKPSVATKWGSPIIMKIGKKNMLVTAAGEIVDPNTGQVVHNTFKKLTYNAPLASNGNLYFIQTDALAYNLSADKPKKLWYAKLPKDRYYASPVIFENIIYAITQNGILSAIDAKTGEVIYSKNTGIKRTVYPSITIAGKKLYISSDNGKTVVVKPGRTYQQLASNSLEKFRGSPLVKDDKIYIRGMKHLYCIGKK